MAEKLNMEDFLQKNSWYFGSGTAEWNILIFGYVIRLMLFYCKKFGVENVYIYHPIFSKMIFLSVFLFFIVWVKIKLLLWEIFFLENSKWQNDWIRKMTFFKKFQDFIIAPLNEMFAFFVMLWFERYLKIKILLPS
jgi:hypothetical protein